MEDKKWYEDYKQVRTPDKERISKIVTDKRGVERKAADYAAAVDITPAMMSRIINGNYAKPLTVDVLVKLSEGNDEVLRDLLSANGMISPEEQNRRIGRDKMRERRMQFMDRERSMQNTVFSELFSKGVPMKRISSRTFLQGSNAQQSSSKFFRQSFLTRYAVEMQGEKPYEWYFILNPSILDEEDLQNNEYLQRELDWNRHRMIERYSVIFLQDAWEPETLKDKKISFVFAERKFYESFVDLMQEAKLHNRMSAILVDLDADKVVDETSLVCTDFQDMSSPFSMPVIEEDAYVGEGGQLFFFFDDNKEDNE